MKQSAKRKLSERDICSKFIMPSLERAGWSQNQIREEVNFTVGPIVVRGNMVRRSKGKRADFVLSFRPNLPIAVIEAKDNNYTIGAGMQQGLDYAGEHALDVPFVFSSNGDGFLFHDRTGLYKQVERELTLDEFPSPDELWQKYRQWKGIGDDIEPLITQPYYLQTGGHEPRYYQRIAVNRTVEAIAKGQKRILLTMATGTGKTFTAFQIIWRLWKAGAAKRILFLVDRTALADQAKNGAFKPFGSAMTKIQNRTVDKAYEIYIALYQAVTGNDEDDDIFTDFSPDFFDLIVIDECHRGSAAEDSSWRRVLEYFKSATQIGLTATPKETHDVSNSDYFGEPIYTYSLKKGIADGFLAPYKVVRFDLDKDLAGWRPEAGKLDRYGNEIEDRIYNQRDMDKKLVLDQRTRLVARKVSEFLTATDRFSKTIVFCEDIDHAERMRQALVNENADLAAANERYVVRITGDNPVGKDELPNFIDPESKYPVIATTSKLMSTGIDAQTCKLIVLDRRIGSMTEFKQIIGRGTRINEDYGKYFFTIIDFKKATENFADPDFDGFPAVIFEPDINDSPVPPASDEATPGKDDDLVADGGTLDEPEWKDEFGIFDDGWIDGYGHGDDEDASPKKYYVDDVSVAIVAERVQYYGEDGKLVTESLKDYTRKKLEAEYVSLDAFLKAWTAAERKSAIIKELEEQGVFLKELAEEVGRDYDPFDLICHVAFDQPPLTRRERAENVRKRNYFTQYGQYARALLDSLLDKYANEGISNLEDPKVLRIKPFSEMGTPTEIVQRFGGLAAYKRALADLDRELYRVG